MELLPFPSTVSLSISKPKKTDQIMCDNNDTFLGNMDVPMCPDKIEAKLITASVADLEEHQTISEQMTYGGCIEGVKPIVELPRTEHDTQERQGIEPLVDLLIISEYES